MREGVERWRSGIRSVEEVGNRSLEMMGRRERGVDGKGREE
jgi:hypothetical protein